jgi:hypothetical protein
MHNNTSEVKPPIWIWRVLLVLVFLLTTWVFHLEEDKTWMFKPINNYLQKKNSESGNKQVILFLGTSLTRCSIDSSHIIENNLEDKLGFKPVVIKIWKNGTKLSTIIEGIPQLNMIHPILIIVEANAINEAPYKKNRIEELSNTLHKFVIPQKYDPEFKTHVSQKNEALIERFPVLDTSELISFRNWAEKLQNSGSKIILVNFPFEMSEEYKKWHHTDTSLYNRNFEFIRKRITFKYLDPKTKWDASYYFDNVHMNEKGCKTFSKWLCNSLVK